MSISAQDFQEGRRRFHDALLARASRSGPVYSGGASSFTPWYDQLFDIDIEPVGSVSCVQALRVGATRQSLEVVLLASHANTSPILFPAGSTITVSYMQGESEEGTFEDVGPTICVKAPNNGMEIEPDHVVARFPLPDFAKPWTMVNLEFSGAITGGKLDCALNFIAR